ncbi:DExH-box splicing factor binding site-domain-containing protein [Nemania serpens]|nr:DExH-box splicing factor binding site-domain-containing protein [Nemania serpens]
MSGTTPQSQAPRIAIKFGASSLAGSKPSSHATNRHGPRQPSSALGKRQRPNALHHDSESGEEDDITGKHEVVRTIDARSGASTDGGVSPSKRRTQEYVISSQRNRDWKAHLRTGKGDRAAARQNSSTNNHDPETEVPDQDKDIKWGLSVRKKSVQAETPSPDDERKGLKEDASDVAAPLSHSPRDADQDAMDALLGKRKPAQHLIIKDAAVSSRPQFSEEDAYQTSMRDAAEVSTIEEYSEIPEGEFGAALLRGMGWKGEEFGSKPKEAKRRPHLMGLGSKEDEEIKKGELAQRHGHRERRPRLDEYRRDREKEKQERSGRYGDSYKSERERDRDRERERRDQDYDHQHRDRYRERDSRGYR